MFILFPDEEIVSQSSNGTVTLTTHRICYEYKGWSKAYNQNIMLEHITSCENYYKTQSWLLYIGGLCLLFGIIASWTSRSSLAAQEISLLVFIAIFCGILYQTTTQNFIVIGSPSTKMKIRVVGMKRDQVLGFINTVEQTKHSRLVKLNTKG